MENQEGNNTQFTVEMIKRMRYEHNCAVFRNFIRTHKPNQRASRRRARQVAKR